MMKKWKIILAVSILAFLTSVVSVAKVACNDLYSCEGGAHCDEKASVVGCMIDCGDNPPHVIHIQCFSSAGGHDPVNIM